MKITDIRLRQVTAIMDVDGPFMEERLAMPLDIYDEFREKGSPQAAGQVDDTHYRLAPVFVQVETDEGVSGISGPTMPGGTAFHVWQLKDLLIGRDPLATEFLWDIMHRSSVHGRQGEPMMAISLIDNALWDLKGKWLKQPVHRLIGGPNRKSMPAYASMLGYNTTDMALVRERALEMQGRGYTAQKWFFRHGPMSGPEGFRANVALAETLREILGEDDDIMLDCWQSMDVNYVVRLAEAIEDIHPRWLEEVAMPDRIDSYRKIREATNIPISGAEHEYTRWGFKRFMDAEALDIIQADLNWAGGLSEVIKIGALATSYDLITICHQGVSPAGMAWSSAQSPIHTPYVEMLVKHARMLYFFDANGGPDFSDGELTVSQDPGFGFDIDESIVESERDIEY
ncbi:MAG: enolase C-terminal domain-like protein [Dehalococcoidia bacterium]|jgi:L-alanine-DL-glutamate epimerase-like enolase superfamily enzyme|nr:enolase C-terminal domain-like protein [Dehalococcoidia bacterium]